MNQQPQSIKCPKCKTKLTQDMTYSTLKNVSVVVFKSHGIEVKCSKCRTVKIIPYPTQLTYS